MGRMRRRMRTICMMLLALWFATAAFGQAGCDADGTRVVARRWDAVLGMGWELRQSCAHPDWPARLEAAAAADAAQSAAARGGAVKQNVETAKIQPLLVRAGDPVRLWSQDAQVRIEMSGVVEQSARVGERVTVRVTRTSDEGGLTVEQIAGVVRAAGDVEMER